MPSSAARQATARTGWRCPRWASPSSCRARSSSASSTARRTSANSSRGSPRAPSRPPSPCRWISSRPSCCSCLLIGFWYEKPSATDAGKKAFIVNRVGDFGFGLGIMLIWTTFGTLDYGAVFANATDAVSQGTYLAIALLLFTGACGKSAQLPLHTWLPDAMEGPTPVSALIHAATMVTAGVYMVARSHVIFEHSPGALTVVAVIGTLTAFFAATIGITQTDIKKVLAYSTVSQLGYMFMACGVGAFSAGIFHLMTHAF